MLKKTIEYKDFNKETRKEDFYFNFTKAELAEMELSTVGGYKETINKIIDARDMPALIKHFKDIVLKAYGVKTDDGRGFRKSEELRNDFASTEAYSILFMELVTDTDAASEFINGIIPDDLSDPSTSK